ncbi:EVE domain-containing protein [Chloroflexota bacterium]
MSIPLANILSLVGTLDDSPGTDTPRERFRDFLSANVSDVGTLRDYVEECLRNKGDNYNRALQDLVNYAASFLGFKVNYGRYKGVVGQIGFDGHWTSPTGFHFVAESKTSDAFTIKTATLVGYVDGLISTKTIPSWDQALGLYVLGRPDPDIHQLENAIVAEKRSHQLRIISVDSLLTLAELMLEYDIGHEEILAVLRPAGPRVDPIVAIMTAIVAETASDEQPVPAVRETPDRYDGETAHWITSVKHTPEETAEECLRKLVGTERIYAFGDRTPGRKAIKPGDWICFYISGGTGIGAHAQVASLPENKPHPRVRDSEQYPWVFGLKNTSLYLDAPTVLDSTLRVELDAFDGKDPDGPWAWFVQATHKISQHDFQVVTGQSA